MRYDTLILGAGMSGLAAGIRHALAGRRVAILEQHSLWGGLNSFYKRAGRPFDTGLHALTNIPREEARHTPLARALRQLRVAREELEFLLPQRSSVQFDLGGEIVRLEFQNDPHVLRAEVARAFPSEIARYDRLVAELPGYDSPRLAEPGTRAELARRLRDPLLAEMLLCPVALYGNAREGDMDWDAFGVIFRSLFLEGIAHPVGGIRRLLDLLRARFLAAGGELRMRCGVARIDLDGDRARGVRTHGGEELEADCVLSSAGLLETLALCGRGLSDFGAARCGRISVLETVVVTSRPLRALGHEDAVQFFNVGPRFDFRAPAEPCALSCGVTCAPDNYGPPRAAEDEGRLRVSVLANAAAWEGFDEAHYADQKARWSESALDLAARFGVDARPHEVFRDTFTPRTIRRFTGHWGGALYGSPDKRRHGDIGLANVRLIGNDEGYVGIVGALISGITVANRVLTEPARAAVAVPARPLLAPSPKPLSAAQEDPA